MKTTNLRDIARITGGELIKGSPEDVVSGVSIDSRTVNEGELFIALKGPNFDGHSFLPEVFKKKAQAALVSKVPEGEFPAIVKVSRTREALLKLAGDAVRTSDIRVIAVTGSNGKTSVKDMLQHVLSERYCVLASRASFNNAVGLSLSLLDIKKEHEFAVFELGSNSPGEISLLARTARPEIAVITNIGRAHLERFGDLEGVFREKTAVLDELPAGSFAVVNGDDPYLKNARCDHVQLIRFGFAPENDIVISELLENSDGQSFSVDGKRYHICLPGRHNVLNAASSIAVAQRLGLEDERINRAFRTFRLQPMRLERKETEGMIFINDAYNANPDSFKSALEVLMAEDALCRGVVAGDMLELGERSEKLHYELGKEIAERGVDFLIASGKYADHLAEGAVRGGMDPDKVVKERSHQGCAMRIEEFSCGDMAVLVKGSRLSRMEEVIRCFTNYYTH